MKINLPKNNQGQIKIRPILIVLMLSFLVFDIIAFRIIFSHKKKEKPVKIKEEKETTWEQLKKDHPELAQINTSAYQNLFNKYPENIFPFNEEKFTIIGKVIESSKNYIFIEINNDRINILTTPTSFIKTVNIKGEITNLDFKPNQLQKGEEESFLVKKSEKNEFILLAIIRAE